MDRVMPGLATASAGSTHQEATRLPKMPMSEGLELADFYQTQGQADSTAEPPGQSRLLGPGQVPSDQGTRLLDHSHVASAISQVQKCLDGHFRQRLLFCSGRKCSLSGQNGSSHHGESATFVWGLSTYAWLLKQAPLLGGDRLNEREVH